MKENVDVTGYMWYSEAAYGLKWHVMMPKGSFVSFFDEQSASDYVRLLLQAMNKF
jgi:hypothetical protein